MGLSNNIFIRRDPTENIKTYKEKFTVGFAVDVFMIRGKCLFYSCGYPLQTRIYTLNTSFAYDTHPPCVIIVQIIARAIYNVMRISRYALPLPSVFRNT